MGTIFRSRRGIEPRLCKPPGERANAATIVPDAMRSVFFQLRQACFRSIAGAGLGVRTGHQHGPVAGCADVRARQVAPIGDEFGPNAIA